MRLEDSDIEDKKPRNLDEHVIENKVWVDTGEAASLDGYEDEVDHEPDDLDDTVEVSWMRFLVTKTILCRKSRRNKE